MANDSRAAPTPNGHALDEKTRDVGDQTPPPIAQPYSHEMALKDLPAVIYALDLFLTSYMVESEKYCEESDPEK